MLGAGLILAVFLWATPKRTDIADGYSLIHFRGNGGMTYVTNEGGIKLAGPVVRDLQVTETAIIGMGGKDGSVAFSIDRATGDVTHSESER